MKTKIGREAVLIEDIDPDLIQKQLQATLINNGYFDAHVKFEIKTKKHASSVIYTASISQPYHYDTIDYVIEDSTLQQNINSLRSNSLIKPGDRYNLQALIDERIRLEKAMKDLGYYYFNADHLLFKADSSLGNKKVNLELQLKPETPAKANQVYHLDQINMIFNENSQTKSHAISASDTIKVDNIDYVNLGDLIHPGVLADQSDLKKGNIYRKEDELATLSRLTKLDVFKFVNIDYKVKDSANTLNTNIYLYPNTKRSMNFGLQAVSKTNNFIGPNLSISFKNRNSFREAIGYQLTIDAGYEVQIGKKTLNQPLNSYLINFNNTFTIPQIISPINIKNPYNRYIPQTTIDFGLSTQKRVNFFTLNSINASYGFILRTSKIIRHKFYPIDITYTDLGKVTAAFDSVLVANPIIRNSLEDQFILGNTYSFYINTQYDDKRKVKSDYYFNINLNIAGNLMYISQTLVKPQEKPASPYQLLGIDYSQYIKTDFDFRYYHEFYDNYRIITRLVAGIGYAFGNSLSMPYNKQFSLGGSTSIRAFRSRSVGPGTYESPDSATFIDQTADIEIEGNIEYRFPIIGFFHGAVFTDFGNVWTIREDTLRPGSQFDSKNFISQLAVGSGIGLRFDVEYFVVRLDLGIPLRVPYREKGNRWIIKEFDLFDRNWRQQNLLLNLGIGYPF